MKEKEIELNAQFSSMYAKLRALKKALNEEQLKIYSESIQTEKNNFLEKTQNLSEELREKIDTLFV
jgi:hypothetical protein